MQTARKIHIELPTNVQKFVGWISGRKYYKEVRSSKHLYRKLDAWGIDAGVYKDELKGKVDEIRILDNDTDEVYSVSVETLGEHGQFLHFKPYRAQIFLPRFYWKKEKKVT